VLITFPVTTFAVVTGYSQPQCERGLHALVRIRPADDVDRVHDGPVGLLADSYWSETRKYVVVHLRPGQPNYPTEYALQLILHLQHLLRRGTDAEAVQHNYCMLDGSGLPKAIHALGDRVVTAGARVACTRSKQQIGDTSIRVVDHGNGLCEVVAGQQIGGKHHARTAEVAVGVADVLGQCSALRERQKRCRYVPHTRCRSDHGVGLGVGDTGVQLSRIGEVERVRCKEGHYLPRRRARERRSSDKPRPPASASGLIAIDRKTSTVKRREGTALEPVVIARSRSADEVCFRDRLRPDQPRPVQRQWARL